uniref:Uncharacterized protein n=1 Tax=Arundo donax TaxID=35708 RepID=A0A0A9H0W9_ARUDO
MLYMLTDEVLEKFSNHIAFLFACFILLLVIASLLITCGVSVLRLNRPIFELDYTIPWHLRLLLN